MEFEYSPRCKELQAQLLKFMDQHIYPNESAHHAEIEANRAKGNPWVPLQLIERLKVKARVPRPVLTDDFQLRRRHLVCHRIKCRYQSVNPSSFEYRANV